MAGPRLRECCKARQKWLARAGTQFTKTGASLLAELCLIAAMYPKNNCVEVAKEGSDIVQLFSIPQ